MNRAALTQALRPLLVLGLVIGLGAASPGPAARDEHPLDPPSVLFSPLYQRVEMLSVFPDQKTFADAVPKEPPRQLMALYREQERSPDFDVTVFVTAHFDMPVQKQADYKLQPDQTVAGYIAAMWNVLERQPDDIERYSSLLPLASPYVVPGGRFSEIYYWDTYFSMVGLEQDARHDLATDMIRNLASLIDRYGHVPNGNRTYYLSRSQPPFFAGMVDLMAQHDGEAAYQTYLPELQREYDYWMEGASGLRNGQAHRHVVRLADGTLLNRYWDDRDVPRDESYRLDVETARRSSRPAAEIYRELRAGAETGWDYSARWLADWHDMATIRTTEILPIDLNSLLAHLEQTLAHAYRLSGNTAKARLYDDKAKTRIAAIHRLMWREGDGVFTDYVWTAKAQSGVVSAATVVPLFFRIATPDEAQRVAETVRDRLLQPGGLVTSAETTGQQWDAPNGWAPLQWMAVTGLRAYGEDALAEEIARRWIDRAIAAYAENGVLVEKYDVAAATAPANGGGGGGEYPLQIGFGWTNGVLTGLMQLYPDATHESLRAHPRAAAQ